LNVCNKVNANRKRCFLYSYQLTLHVTSQSVDIYPKIFTKITFNEVQNLVVLPGDQIKTSFKTDYTEQDSVRIMPEIYDPSMPQPIKDRYQFQGVTRLPCDDRKVADALQCQGFFVYCTEPDQKIRLSIQGAGDLMNIESTCERFMAQAGFNWSQE
jgi:hypothetical protein